MFHAFYKLSKSIVLPIICILIEISLLNKKGITCNKKDLCGKWFLFWIGFGSLSTGLMQSLNPSYTATLLDVSPENFIIIRELGCANVGMGIIGILSIKLESFRKPAAIVVGVFILGAIIIHLQRIHNIDFGEAVSLIDDLWIFAVACFTILYKPRKTLST